VRHIENKVLDFVIASTQWQIVGVCLKTGLPGQWLQLLHPGEKWLCEVLIANGGCKRVRQKVKRELYARVLHSEHQTAVCLGGPDKTASRLSSFLERLLLG
jgi:hypothetical protein